MTSFPPLPPLPSFPDSSPIYLDSRTDSFVDPTIVYPFKSRTFLRCLTPLTSSRSDLTALLGHAGSADIYGATLDVRAAEDAVDPPVRPILSVDARTQMVQTG